jgi:16S rRNA (guanine966-N2)-methyltransferase
VRIIGGTHKGRIIKVPKGLPVRPTTDFAKEGLFNILQNRVNLDEISVLDLFSGTGHISLEFASRGARFITAVDRNYASVSFLKSMAADFNFQISALKSDVFDFLKAEKSRYDLIFADPPYDLPEIPLIHQYVFERSLLNPGALLIIEHGPKTNLENLEGFIQQRKYGNVNFSFFEEKK